MERRYRRPRRCPPVPRRPTATRCCLAGLAGQPGPRHLDSDFEMVQDTFRKFADDKLVPVAEHIHRHNDDIPEDIISGLAEMGAFGLSVPEEYGGFAVGGESDYLAMVIATEELSRGSLGAGGSLITRPEILTRALVAGGTEDQKQTWLPSLASGEVMAAVAVTEPDFGSDVAGIKVTASPDRRRLVDQRREDVVHVRCPRRRADAPGPHRPRPLEDPQRAVVVRRAQARGVRGTASSSPTIAAASSRVGPSTPSATGGCTRTRSRSTTGSSATTAWSGATRASGKGFYFQMAGFENGRLQTAARAVGRDAGGVRGGGPPYAADRVVFGHPIGDYQLTRAKLGGWR